MGIENTSAFMFASLSFFRHHCRLTSEDSGIELQGAKQSMQRARLFVQGIVLRKAGFRTGVELSVPKPKPETETKTACPV
jgi:hypothetical protein